MLKLTLSAPAAALGLLAMLSCGPKPTTTTTTTPGGTPAAGDDAVPTDNPLFVKSALQYEAPNFEAVKTEHFLPAFEHGMKKQLEEIATIANAPEAATFENTLVAMQRTGELLRRASDVFDNLTGTMSTDELRAIDAELAPRLSAHRDAISLDAKLFARIETVHAARESLPPEDKRLVEEIYKDAVRAGAKLGEAEKDEIRKVNAELAKLTTEFGQNLLAFTKERAVVVDDAAELAGLSDSDIAGLAAAAKEAGKEGKYLIALMNTTRQPIMTRLENRDLRKRVWEASALRGASNNLPLAAKIATLRANKAKILGFATWADYVLEAQMAKKPDAALKMLDDLAPKVMAKAKTEAKAIQKAIKADGKKFKLEPWDWTYYAEKVRAKKFKLDADEVRKYFELDSVLKNGVFFAMNQLFGIRFEEREDLPVYHPDVRTFEVFDEDGTSIGLFYADYFAREGKRGGAWMNAMVGQSKLLGRKPVIVNVLNIPKPAEGQPALMTFDETQTMFHEMGHALHGMFSDANYPKLAGTSVPRDFVEFPSQFEEDWSIDPRVLASYAKHHETGEVIPPKLLKKLLASRKFNQGFDSLEYLGAALLDLEWAVIAPGSDPGDPLAFEEAALEKHGVKHPAVPPRYRTPYFAHVFAGGYSAGYYAYIWTEVLAADAFAFMQTKGGLTRENGDAFRKAILSRGNTIDPMQQYVNFRGKEPSVAALLKRRGLN